MADWNDYRVFLAIARAGSIAGAARALGVNHSTVSRRLAQLEAVLGARLFDRVPDGYTVTDAGEAILQAAAAAEDTLTEAAARVVANDTKLSGELKVSAPENMLNTVILPKMREFQINYPNIVIKFDARDDIVSLHRYESDIALRVTKQPPDGLMGSRLVTKAVALYASHSYAKQIDAGSSDDLFWLGAETAGRRPKWVEDHYFAARQTVEITSQTALHIAARSGLGIAELPCRIGDADPELTRVDPMQSRSDRELWFLFRRDLQQTARLTVFRAFLTDLIQAEEHLFDGRFGDDRLHESSV